MKRTCGLNLVCCGKDSVITEMDKPKSITAKVTTDLVVSDVVRFFWEHPPKEVWPNMHRGQWVRPDTRHGQRSVD